MLYAHHCVRAFQAVPLSEEYIRNVQPGITTKHNPSLTRAQPTKHNPPLTRAQPTKHNPPLARAQQQSTIRHSPGHNNKAQSVNHQGTTNKAQSATHQGTTNKAQSVTHQGATNKAQAVTHQGTRWCQRNRGNKTKTTPHLICFQQLNGLSRGKQREEALQHEVVVAIVGRKVAFELQACWIVPVKLMKRGNPPA
eukprot:1137150-Pelagomonas_calceolata.AAC.13